MKLIPTVAMIALIKKGETWRAVSHPDRKGVHDLGVTVKYEPDRKNHHNPDKIQWYGTEEEKLSEDFPLNEYTMKYMWEKVPNKRKALNFHTAFEAYENGKTIEDGIGRQFTKVLGSSVLFSEKDIRGEWHIYD